MLFARPRHYIDNPDFFPGWYWEANELNQRVLCKPNNEPALFLSENEFSDNKNWNSTAEHGITVQETSLPISGALLPVGSAGYVQYVGHIGSDKSICENARLGSGSELSHPLDDVNLIRYLMRHKHTSPLEFGEIIFRIKIPMDLLRQVIRHRTASAQEYSTRYREAIDDTDFASPEEWRAGDASIRQGSKVGAPLKKFDTDTDVTDEQLRERLSWLQKGFQEHARSLYQHKLDRGVAREQARRDLPLSTYTLLAWKMDVHNLLHFLGLRLHEHAQLETRQFAQAIARFVKALFPVCYQAFEDFHPNMGGLLLSRQEVEALRKWVSELRTDGYEKLTTSISPHADWHDHAAARKDAGLAPRNGEFNEFCAKLARLGFAPARTQL